MPVAEPHQASGHSATPAESRPGAQQTDIQTDMEAVDEAAMGENAADRNWIPEATANLKK